MDAMTSSTTASEAQQQQEQHEQDADRATRAAKNTGIVFHISLLYNLALQHERWRPWWSRIEPLLVLGALPLREKQHLRRLTHDEGVAAVVTMNEPTELLPNLLATPVSPQDWQDAGVAQCMGATTDFGPPTLETIRRCVAFVHEHVDAQRRVTYVHCKAGRGRSTVVVVAFLMQHRSLALANALALVRHKRPHVSLHPAQRRILEAFARSCAAPFVASPRPPRLSSETPR